MQFIRDVPHEQVLDAFQHDSLVVAELTKLGKTWPTPLAEKVAVLRNSRRPANRLMALKWGLYLLDRVELLDKVFTVWTRQSIRDTIAQYHAGSLAAVHMGKVRQLLVDLPQTFQVSRFHLIGYLQPDIWLEEGHHHAVAAEIAGLLPLRVNIFLGR